MPVPKPRSGETQKAFISRCASALAKSDADRPQAQRLAMCYSAWRKPHEDFVGIFKNFLSFFGAENGLNMYFDFLHQGGLDDRKPYSPAQLFESFQWIEPSISYWRMDPEAKYYKVRLITANISMNRNDYTDPEYMRHASSNLAWRPLNLDHKHNLRLPFPRNRLEIGKMSEEGDCIEAVLRIANGEVTVDTYEDVQALIESGVIRHPSIEAFPMCSTRIEGGKRVPVCGYQIEEVALLRKNRSLPGDPLSKVFPVPLNESLSNRFMECMETSSNLKDEQSMTEGEKNLERQADFRQIPTQMQCPNCKEVFPDITETEGDDLTCPRCGKPGLVAVPLNVGANTYNLLGEKNMSDPGLSDLTPCQTEINALNAKITSLEVGFETDKVKMEQAHNAVVEQKNKDIVDLSRKNSELLRNTSEQVIELEMLKKRVADLSVEVASKDANFKQTVTPLRLERDEFQEKLKHEERQHAHFKSLVDDLQEKATIWRGKYEDANEKRNTALAEKAEAEQKSLNEVRERARYQNESADLRSQLADTTEKYSQLSQLRVEDSKRILRLQNIEEEFASAKEEWQKQRESYEETLTAARKRIQWGDDRLKKLGMAFQKSEKE